MGGRLRRKEGSRMIERKIAFAVMVVVTVLLGLAALK